MVRSFDQLIDAARFDAVALQIFGSFRGFERDEVGLKLRGDHDDVRRFRFRMFS